MKGKQITSFIDRVYYEVNCFIYLRNWSKEVGMSSEEEKF